RKALRIELGLEEDYSLSFTPEGQWLVTGDHRFLDPQNGRQVRTAEAGRIALGYRTYALVREGARRAMGPGEITLEAVEQAEKAAAMGMRVELRDLQTGRLLHTYYVPDAFQVALSPDDQLIAVGLGLDERNKSRLKLY